MITRTYESLSDFFDSIDESKAAPELLNQEWDSFSGATIERARETRYAWNEPFENVETVTPSEDSRTEYVWSEYDGDEMDVERLWEGRPCLRRRVKRAGNRSKSGRVVTVYKNIDYHGGIGESTIQADARKTMAEIDKLESDGYRVEVYVVSHVSDWANARLENLLVRIKVKSAEEPLSMGSVAAGMSPWFLRRWIFAQCECIAKEYGSTVRPGYGNPRPLPESMKTVLPA